MNPLISEILAAHMPPRPRWDADPYAVPLCCGPRHGIFVDGRCATCGKAEQHEPDMASDEVRRLSGADPGRTPQSECRHDFFVLANGQYRCSHCGKTLEREEA